MSIDASLCRPLSLLLVRPLVVLYPLLPFLPRLSSILFLVSLFLVLVDDELEKDCTII